MQSISATEARKTFFDLLKQTNLQHEIIEVQHKSGKAILMSSEEYESLIETLHLLSQPNFSEKLAQSIKEANEGDLSNFEEVFGEPL